MGDLQVDTDHLKRAHKRCAAEYTSTFRIYCLRAYDCILFSEDAQVYTRRRTIGFAAAAARQRGVRIEAFVHA